MILEETQPLSNGIDTAQAYGNEEGVGEGVRTSGLRRDEIFEVRSALRAVAADPVAISI